MTTATLSSVKSNKKLNVLIVITIAGFAHWFFGNLYEMTVLTPNSLFLGPDGLEIWRSYSQVSDPTFYFVPFNLPTLGVTFAAVWFGRYLPSAQRKWLIATASLALCVALLTLFIITQVNLNLYFGPVPTDRAYVWSKLQLGAGLGLLRVLLEIGVLFCAVQSYRRIVLRRFGNE